MKKFKFSNKFWFLILLSGLSANTMGQGNGKQLVSRIAALLETSYKFFGSDIRKQTRISEKYDSLFNLLSEDQKRNPTAVANERTIEGKILTLAQYKSSKPQFFSEISQKYIFGLGATKEVALSSPPLIAAFTSEPYRLVWEYYLLKPPSAGMSSAYDRRAADALATINNSASAITLEMVYRYSTKDAPIDYPIVTRQKLIILTLGKMPSETSALSLFEIVNLSSQTKESGVKRVAWAPPAFIKEMLAGKHGLKTENNWRLILNRIEADKRTDAKTKNILSVIKP